MRALMMLVVCLVLAHAALLWARDALVIATAEAYGNIGIDREGRVRHWVEDEEAETVTFLGADEMRAGETVARDEWRKEYDLPIDFGNCYPSPFPNTDADWIRSDTSIRDGLRRATGWAWSEEHGLFVARGPSATEIDLRGWGRLYALFQDMDGWLLVGEDGRRFSKLVITRDTLGTPSFELSEIPIEPPLLRTGEGRGWIVGDEFAGVLGAEFGVVDRSGRFKQRQPLGVLWRDVYATDDYESMRGFLASAAGARPDLLPLRAVVVKPGEEPLVREIVLEPATPFLRRVAFGHGIVASLRPLPLNLFASTTEGASSVGAMMTNFWKDPLFGGGANRRWLVVTGIVSALAALLAWRWASLRAPRARWFWAAAVMLLGPMGLLWMRLTIPWVAIENGRAVNIESPPWPEPQPTGTEIYAIR